MKRPLSLVCLVVVLISVCSAGFSNDYDEKYKEIDQKNLTVSGRVEDINFKPVDDGYSMRLYLDCGVICYMCDEYQRDPEKCPFRIRIGSKVSVKGKVRLFERASNPGQFDMRAFYEISDIHYALGNARIETISEDCDVVGNAFYGIRESGCRILDEALPKMEASVMKTMLLGQKSELDDDVEDLYRRNGIAHVLAISGLHISLLGMGLFRLLKKSGAPHGCCTTFSFLLVLLYGVVSGFSVSSLRAVIMFLINMIAEQIGRAYDMVTSMAVAACILLVSNPLYIYHTGFIFSFGCILGMGFLMKPLCGGGNRVLQALTMSVITYPIYMQCFYQIPIYSMFLNMLVIPVMIILVPAGFALILAGAAHLGAASWPRNLIVGILRFFETGALSTDSLPGHFFTPGAAKGWQLLIYCILTVVVIVLHENEKRILRRMGKKRIIFRAVGWLLMLLASLILSIRIRNGTDITFLDVGQGDCTYLRNRDITMLFDCGSSQVSEVGKYRLFPYLKYEGSPILDIIAVSHTDTDHISGVIEMLENGRNEGFKIRYLALPDIALSDRNENYLKLEIQAKRMGIKLLYIGQGDVLTVGRTTIECLWPEHGFRPPDNNESSLVFSVQCDNVRLLMTGDVSGNALAGLADAVSQNENSVCTVLKVPHHGSRSSSDSIFLKAAEPDISIISVGAGNSYNHPHEETLNKLKEADTMIFRTDCGGAVMLHIKKNQVSLQRGTT